MQLEDDGLIIPIGNTHVLPEIAGAVSGGYRLELVGVDFDVAYGVGAFNRILRRIAIENGQLPGELTATYFARDNMDNVVGRFNFELQICPMASCPMPMMPDNDDDMMPEDTTNMGDDMMDDDNDMMQTQAPPVTPVRNPNPTVTPKKDSNDDYKNTVAAAGVAAIATIGYQLLKLHNPNSIIAKRVNFTAKPTSNKSLQYNLSTDINKNWSANFTVDKQVKINDETTNANSYRLKFEYSF